MAAESLLTFAAEGILTKVTSLVDEQITLAWGFKEDLQKLAKMLSLLQKLLNDASYKPKSEVLGEWVKKLKAIALAADDVVEECNYEDLRRKVELKNHMKRKVLNFLSASNPILFRLKMAHRIKHINASLVDLREDATLIGLFETKINATPQGLRPDREQTDSLFAKDEKVIGRDEVVSNIVKSLINSNNQQNLSVMAIVGVGGLGKTTLAKSVYNQAAIDTHFHKKIWVCVSNTFEVDSILSQMLGSLKPEKTRDALLKSLLDELTGKRCLLILDDVWSDDREKWESLMSCLSKLNYAPGSSIIITTRSANVASIIETLPRRDLGKLSNDECWSILKQRALENDDHIDSDRETIGRAIAEKCGGVPLVAKVVLPFARNRLHTTRLFWLSQGRPGSWTFRFSKQFFTCYNSPDNPPVEMDLRILDLKWGLWSSIGDGIVYS
ncbi:hypothetical protein M0R45_020350 [Rubus argutus]|uniref:Uncharacterized protein n=1 Tax=Rubus argutus TaxID=59490 RepID=A0AAW1X9W8_RUBAR